MPGTTDGCRSMRHWRAVCFTHVTPVVANYVLMVESTPWPQPGAHRVSHPRRQSHRLCHMCTGRQEAWPPREQDPDTLSTGDPAAHNRCVVLQIEHSFRVSLHSPATVPAAAHVIAARVSLAMSFVCAYVH